MHYFDLSSVRQSLALKYSHNELDICGMKSLRIGSEVGWDRSDTCTAQNNKWKNAKSENQKFHPFE